MLIQAKLICRSLSQIFLYWCRKHLWSTCFIFHFRFYYNGEKFVIGSHCTFHDPPRFDGLRNKFFFPLKGRNPEIKWSGKSTKWISISGSWKDVRSAHFIEWLFAKPNIADVHLIKTKSMNENLGKVLIDVFWWHSNWYWYRQC